MATTLFLCSGGWQPVAEAGRQACLGCQEVLVADWAPWWSSSQPVCCPRVSSAATFLYSHKAILDLEQGVQLLH